MNSRPLNRTQLEVGKTAANDLLSQLSEKYPTLRGYLVLCWRGEQAELDSAHHEVLKKVPSLIVPSESRTQMEMFLRNPVPKDLHSEEGRKWQKRFDSHAEGLRFEGAIQVELRFKQLDYELIWTLQGEELVDQDLTPQTKTSIRIVLGKLSTFARGIDGDGVVL